MSQFRTTADLIDSVLRRCGELTDGNSPYESQALDYLNQIHHTVITGRSELNLEVDEPFLWARAPRPIILELQPPYTSGSVALTQGSKSGTFSAAPSYSVKGWFIKVDGVSEILRIGAHTASSTSFDLDAAYPGSDVSAGTFTVFKLDYDLVPDYLVIDTDNDKLDFIVSGTTEITATLTAGTYTPANLIAHVATQLQAADSARTYTGSYDTVKRVFSITSNLASSAIFKPQGAGTNAHRSAWATLGFDYENVSTSAATHTGIYPVGSVVRLVGPGRIHYGNNSGQVEGVDALTLDKRYPINSAFQGVPTHFAQVREKTDGTYVIRFNAYPDRKMRVEFEHIPQPKDLKDNAKSIPLIPRKFNRVLEYGAAFYLLTDKQDDKAQTYFQIAQGTLSSMMKFNRKELQRVGINFGAVIARPEQRDVLVSRLNRYGYDSGNY